MNQYLYCNRNYILRKILNTEEQADIVKDLIEGILEIKIKDILINPYIKKDEGYSPREENLGVVDVRITTDELQDYNVGIQFLDGKHIQTKIALYYLYVHSNQIFYDDERKISKTITINFMDFPYQYKSSDYHEIAILNKFKSIDFKEEAAEAHIIELPKFKVSDLDNLTKAEQWIGYIKGENQKLIDEIINKNMYIKKLDELVQEYWNNETI